MDVEYEAKNNKDSLSHSKLIFGKKFIQNKFPEK